MLDIGMGERFKLVIRSHEGANTMSQKFQVTGMSCGHCAGVVQSAVQTIDPSAQIQQEIRRVSEKGTPDEILALAAKYPPEYQPLLYQNAAWKAATAGDSARAKEIAEKISDPVQRRQVIDQLDNLAARTVEGDAWAGASSRSGIPEVHRGDDGTRGAHLGRSDLWPIG